MSHLTRPPRRSLRIRWTCSKSWAAWWHSVRSYRGQAVASIWRGQLHVPMLACVYCAKAFRLCSKRNHWRTAMGVFAYHLPNSNPRFSCAINAHLLTHLGGRWGCHYGSISLPHAKVSSSQFVSYSTTCTSKSVIVYPGTSLLWM